MHDHDTAVPSTARATRHTLLAGINRISTGREHRETVVLVHAVGFDLTAWDRQIDALRSAYRVIAFDLPGHGRSAGGPEACTFANKVATVERIVTDAGCGPVHLVGISVGGLIAQATALERPELVRSLVLIGTAPAFPEPVRAGMRERAAALRRGGMPAVVQSSLERWFTPDTMLRRPHVIDRVTKLVLANDPSVQAAMWEMVAGFDVRDRLGEIRLPTLVLVGEHDPSTPPPVAAELAAGIRGAELAVLPDASHIATLEVPDAVNAEVLRFLGTLRRD